MTDTGACGTYAGWQRHHKLNSEACEPCKEARRTYMREYRKRNPTYADKGRQSRTARGRAMTRLAREYQARFYELYREELED